MTETQTEITEPTPAELARDNARQLADAAARRRELDDPSYAGPIDDEALHSASAATVARWARTGRLAEGYGVAPDKRERR
jgi:hypothetical protein